MSGMQSEQKKEHLIYLKDSLGQSNRDQQSSDKKSRSSCKIKNSSGCPPFCHIPAVSNSLPSACHMPMV